MAPATRQSDNGERAILSRIRETAAWREAEAEAEAERLERRKTLVKERKALVKEREKEEVRLHEDHLAALAKVEKAAVELKEAQSEAAEAQRAASSTSNAYDRKQRRIEAELLESAGPEVEALRAWARDRWWTIKPGNRTVKAERGLPVAVPRTEAFVAVRNLVLELISTERGPLFDLCMEALDPETMAARVKELRDQAQAAIAEAERDDSTGPLATVQKLARRVLSAHDARSAPAEDEAAG